MSIPPEAVWSRIVEIASEGYQNNTLLQHLGWSLFRRPLSGHANAKQGPRQEHEEDSAEGGHTSGLPGLNVDPSRRLLLQCQRTGEVQLPNGI